MSKGEPKVENGDARKRRRKGGGLRVPSDNVPRDGAENLSAAPVPEGAGLAASVAESFGVGEAPSPAPPDTSTRAATDEQVTIDQGASEQGQDDGLETPTIANDSLEEPDEMAEESIDVGDFANAATTGDFVELDDDEEITRAELPPLPPDESEEEDNEGGSVDIPFDDNEDTGIRAAVQESDSDSDSESDSASDSDSLDEALARVDAIAADGKESPTPISSKTAPAASDSTSDSASTSETGDGQPKPRFVRAMTMALNESDLEEVRGTSKAATPPPDATPAVATPEPGVAAPPDEVTTKEPSATASAPTKPVAVGPAPAPSTSTPTKPTAAPASATKPAAAAATAAPKKKRADTAEPPPPPPAKPVAKAATPVKKPPPAPADDKKRRKGNAWFEEIFDEDYLRTLPFLTPQATKFEADFVMESLGLEPGAQVLDVGCGYGRHAMEIATHGYHVVGLDISMPLLLRGADEAKRRGLSINFVHGDMREMTFESQFDGAYCLFSSFGYFDDETNKRTAQNIARALKPGARLVAEVLNRDYLVADLPSRVWWEGDGCVVLEEVEFNYFSSRIVSNRSVVFDDGRQLEQEISLRSFSLHELGKFLHAVGFRVLEISGSMSTRGRFFGAHSRDIVVVAEKREDS